MRFTFGDGMAAAIETAGGFRWGEYGPFFAIFLAQVAFLGLTTQLGSEWAMGLVAPVVRWTGGEANLHYPAFFAFLPILMGWVESTLYVFPGCVLIPLALLRICARSDRALSLGARSASRLAGAIVPTLVATLLGIGVMWGWERNAAPAIAKLLSRYLSGDLGFFAAWAAALLGAYAILSLVLYVPVAAVQARATFFSAFGRGIRFGVLALPPTMLFAVVFALPAIAIQFFLARQGTFLVTKLRPESIAVLLAVYAILASVATYLTYGAAVRLYRIARADD